MKAKIFSASLLVAGTAIGGGMLALPVVTAEGGFWPACLMYGFCWLFMAATGLLMLEACLWLPRDSNVVSLASHLLGKKGKLMSWVLYLFLFYCLTLAYVVGGGEFVRALFPSFSSWMAIFVFTLIFSPIVYFGTKVVDRFNLLLMTGLIVSFFAFIWIGFQDVRSEQLPPAQWGPALLALPVIFTSFSYQGVIPSLTSYFNQDGRKMRKVILIGSFIPLLVYVLWEFLILGIVPVEGPYGLAAAKAQGQTAVYPLKDLMHSSYVYAIGQSFAFFALTTSFLGVTLGLFDFLADGLKMEKKGTKKIFLFLLVFLPPMLVGMWNPTLFLRSLSYAGGIGCALLLGLMPVLMVWSGRYGKKRKTDMAVTKPSLKQLPGGKALLVILIAFVLFELIVELMSEIR